jgi:hypothetical protein
VQREQNHEITQLKKRSLEATCMSSSLLKHFADYWILILKIKISISKLQQKYLQPIYLNAFEKTFG